MQSDEDILERLEQIRMIDQSAEARLKEAQRLSKMPFHLRIQEKGMEDSLVQTYDTQEWAFEKIVRKHYKELWVGKWKDEFCLFWAGFLKGEYKSINQYLKRKNFK